MGGARVPDAVVQRWRSLIEGHQVIGQGELLPSAVARETWASELTDASIVQYLDNSSAERALVKGYSPSPASAPLISWVADADVRLGARSWYDRVPSPSNPADGPSRLHYAGCSGWQWRKPVFRGWSPPPGC